MSSAAVRMREGEREAYGELFREFHPRVAAVCGYLLGSPEEAKDAASEVFARLPIALRTYDRSRPFSSWLLTVAGNYCTDLLRRRRSEQRFLEPADPKAPQPPSPAASPLQELLSEEQKRAVRSAIAGLPEQYRRPLVLRYYRELSYDEIARDLELTRGNVATLIFRAKERLRGVLARRGIGAVPARTDVRPSYALSGSAENWWPVASG
jgi:RNA polymerase sigma-70 factor, ECF subfamily